MKKLGLAALAALTFAGPLAVSTEAAAYQHGDRDRDRYDRRDRDRDDRWDRDDRRHRWEQRRDRRDRRDDRWDRRRHNGYYYNNRFHWGSPPRAYVRHHSYAPAYRAWRRGDRIPHYYRDRYVVVRDYDHYHLRRPPRGYHWVRDDRGDFLLVAVATGIIMSLILSSGY